MMVVTGLFLCASVAQGQQGGATLSASAIKIRYRIRSLARGEEVTILMKGRPSYHGDLREAGDRSFSVYEVDEKQSVTIQYEDVKKVSPGYRGYNSVTSRHVNPLHSRIAIVALAGALVAIVVAVAVAKD